MLRGGTVRTDPVVSVIEHSAEGAVVSVDGDLPIDWAERATSNLAQRGVNIERLRGVRTREGWNATFVCRGAPPHWKGSDWAERILGDRRFELPARHLVVTGVAATYDP